MAKMTCTLRHAFQESILVSHVRDQLGALDRKHRAVIDQSIKQRVADSMNLDDATRPDRPQEHRWDYLISSPRNQLLFGLEIHHASDKEISVIISKKQKSLEYLRDHIMHGMSIGKWYWVSSASVGFTNTERARRRLDQCGIRFAGRRLKTL
jgi:hypothetical protein